MLSAQQRESPSQKTEPGEKDWFSRWEPPVQGLAGKATDLDALRTAVVDAAGVGYGLWFSYLFVLLYFAIATGAVTHRDLLLESGVKLPFLNVELPLNAFFILGPLVFLVVHAYVLLHFLLLAGKVGAFHIELQKQIPEDDEKRTQLRRQLPSNIFVQFLAGPREVRTGIVGFLLKSVAAISLVAGPIALLVLFQLQFLPYHNPWITWWQRIAVVLDLALLWLLWRPIVRGETALLTWDDLARVKMAGWLLVSLSPVLLVFAIATFPGEWLEENVPPGVRLVPTTLEAWQLPSVAATQSPGSGWATLRELLVAGKVNCVTRKPQSLWSNVLVLPNFDIGESSNSNAESKTAPAPKAVSLRGRRLEGAIFVDAHLRNGDFTGAQLARVNFLRADLRGAKFECDWVGVERKCAQLQGASLDSAQLQGASLNHAQLPGSSLDGAKLQGASLMRAQLQGASLVGSQLQGASLNLAGLQGASLDSAQLQGASLDYVQLQRASLGYAQLQRALLTNVFVWETKPPAEKYLEGSLLVMPWPEPKYSGLDCPFERVVCDWTDASYSALKALIEAVPEGPSRHNALKLIELLGQKPYEEDVVWAEGWHDLAAKSRLSVESYLGELAQRLIGIGCAADGAPYVVAGLIAQLDYRFEDNPSAKAEVARAFFDEANCPGAKGLSEENKAKLRRVGGAVSPQPSPGTASR